MAEQVIGEWQTHIQGVPNERPDPLLALATLHPPAGHTKPRTGYVPGMHVPKGGQLTLPGIPQAVNEGLGVVPEAFYNLGGAEYERRGRGGGGAFVPGNSCSGRARNGFKTGMGSLRRVRSRLHGPGCACYD